MRRKDFVRQKDSMQCGVAALAVMLSDGRMWFAFPFADYPMQVDIEMESEPYGVWSTTLMDTQSSLDGCDGYSGDYKLTVTTANGSLF